VDVVDDKQLKYRLDKALANGKVSQTSIFVLMIIFYAIGIMSIWPLLLAHANTTMLYIFAVGLFLAFFYTANPIGLKYKALGDITIFLCFGPLLMQCISMMLTGRVNQELFLYTIPIGECIMIQCVNFPS
jgi:1,4-dihydroxy-2-naphthoate octaprenyltransferase